MLGLRRFSMLIALFLVFLAPSSAYISRFHSLVPQYFRVHSKISRKFASSRLNAKLSPFDAYVAENNKNLDDINAYWSRQAKETLHWDKPFVSAVTNGFGSGDISWFPGGELNICYNCIDRHLPRLANKPAIVFEGDIPEETRTITYAQLHKDVCTLANVMVHHGVQKGDVVTTYLPTCPELVTVMLACARIGAVHKCVALF